MNPRISVLMCAHTLLVLCLTLSVDVEEEEKDELDRAASKLTEIADDIPFTPSDIEPDSEEGAFH